jgi:hypothetical protein
MKKKTIDLNVDFIGGQGPLKKGDEQLLAEYLQTQRAARLKHIDSKPKLSLRRKQKQVVA